MTAIPAPKMGKWDFFRVVKQRKRREEREKKKGKKRKKEKEKKGEKPKFQQVRIAGTEGPKPM